MTKSLSVALVEDIRSCNDQRQQWISLHKEINNNQKKKVWIFGAERGCYSQIYRISFLLPRCFTANIISFWVKTEKKITWYSTTPSLETWQFCHQYTGERCHYSWKIKELESYYTAIRHGATPSKQGLSTFKALYRLQIKVC